MEMQMWSLTLDIKKLVDLKRWNKDKKDEIIGWSDGSQCLVF